jgi:hypothetical protein
MPRIEFLKVLVVLSSTLSCSGPVVKEGRGVRFEVARIDLSRVRFTRPGREPLSPAEVREVPPLDEDWNCLSPPDLWAEVLMRESEVRRCLNSLKPGRVPYRLRKQVDLELLFETGQEGERSCLEALLPKIPLPRELYFFAETSSTGGVEPLSVSLDPKSGAWWEWDLLTPQRRLLFPVPPPRELKNAKDLEAYLLTWVFSLFFPEQGPIRGAYVPEWMVNRCFGAQRKALAPPVFWP